MLRRKCWLAASVGLALMALAACDGNPSAPDSGPVITIEDDWNGYPTALVSGKLTEKEGCLLIHGQVVFWPKGTSWVAESHAVVQVDGSKVIVGDRFTGGGGSYEPTTDFNDLLGSADAGQRITDCVATADAESVLVVTPH